MLAYIINPVCSCDMNIKTYQIYVLILRFNNLNLVLLTQFSVYMSMYGFWLRVS